FSLFAVSIPLLFTIPAAYAFSRFRFAGRKTMLFILLLLNAFPSTLSMFAIYRLFKMFNLLNSYLGLVIAYTGMNAIFALWNMKGYFDSIPISIEEAARIDGANDLIIIAKIVSPLAKPSIIVTATMIFINVWSEYIFAITFLTGTDKYTLAAGLYSLQASGNGYATNWPVFSAGAILVTIPVLVLFFIFQRYMVSGLTLGGVKE
ncbi:MAG: ABC transporter permease subunit, partial [Ruminococcaceae bacterium]|nr:ABC transporter permease subunit [Oscillospiraceae bacterium]